MAYKDPFDALIDSISNLLAEAREQAGQPFTDSPLEEGIEERLKFLESAIMKFNEIADEEVKDKNLTNKDVVDIIFNKSDLLPKDDKKMVEKTLSLSRDALSMKFALTVAEMRSRAPADKFGKGKKVTSKEVKKRQTKFKNTQGNQKWKKI